MLSSGSSGTVDFVGKLLIIGDSAVGKTSILLRYCDNTFTFSQIPTLGIDYKIKTFDVDGKKLKLQIWDTAGQEKFRTITESYYKGSAGVILTYACNDRKSFENVGSWMKQIDARSRLGICKILVANKCDALTRVVSTEEGQQLADSYGIKFFEVSAKEDFNIKELFDAAAKDVKDFCVAYRDLPPKPFIPDRVVNSKCVCL